MPASRTVGPEGTTWGALAALGTSVVFATTESQAIATAKTILSEELAAIDLACSRFRADSELTRVHLASGRPVVLSPLLGELIRTAIEVARDTGGAVDPTVGTAVIELGYDRDFFDICDNSEMGAVRPAPGWRCIELDADNRVLEIPEGVRLDLGSTAKAFAADRASSRIAEATGCGVLVNLGGDISLAGAAPVEGWPIGLAAACTTSPAESDVVVAIRRGGLASSGTGVRSWWRGGQRVHHIIDPETGMSAKTCWQLVSVTAASCVAANAASTAAIIWGEEAPDRLSGLGLACRLVRNGGTVLTLGGWPAEHDDSIGPSLKEARPCPR